MAFAFSAFVLSEPSTGLNTRGSDTYGLLDLMTWSSQPSGRDQLRGIVLVHVTGSMLLDVDLIVPIDSSR
jgi:hypothetical protein